MSKIRGSCRAGLAGLVLVCASAPLAAQVSGRISIMEKNDKPTPDLGQTVLWLDPAASAPAPAPAKPLAIDVATEGKQFVPRVAVLPVGSVVSFPNHDPFNHNVFSLSEEKTFDLGLYGRGSAKSVTFDRPGIIRVYCNVHAVMRAFIIVAASPYFAQPGSDGTFRFDGVPPGDYVLRVWHERTRDWSQPVKVTAGAMAPLTITLDARGYKYVQHTDKEGKSYYERTSRY
jgi:plastocyanin